MTLIATCLTPAFLVHVSDRRLTRPDTGDVIEEEATKAILFGRHVIWGYTGLAALPGARYYVKTDFWLLDRLKDDGRISIERIRADASAAFAAMRLEPRHKRHAFVAVGWRVRPSQQPTAALAVVSNALANDLTWLSEAENEFTIMQFDLPLWTKFVVSVFGQGLRDRERVATDRLVARVLPHGATAVARILVNAVQQVAARNPAVGDRLLVGVLPLAAATTAGPGMAMPFAPLGDPLPGHPSSDPEFYYVPGAGSARFLKYGPHWTDGTMQIASPMSAYGQTAETMWNLPSPRTRQLDRWGAPSKKTPPN